MSTMIPRTILFLLPVLLSGLALAQEDDAPRISPERMEQIKAQKSAFITQRLHLSPEEARAFWPVYDRYDAEMEAARKEQRSGRRDRKDAGTLTEAEASKALDKNMKDRQDQLDIQKRYVAEFKKSIGAVKTLQLEGAERDFNRELLKRMRPGGNDHPDRPGMRR